MKIAVIKGFDHKLIAAHDSDLELIKKMTTGEMYEFEFKKPRNIKFHRKFFALLNLTYENQQIYNDITRMRKELTKAVGYYESFLNHKGVLVYEAKSISFASMDEIEFSQFYNKFLDVIIKIFKFDKETIEENLENFY